MKNNKFFKKFAATFLAAAILLASAPLSGFAELNFLDLFNISANAQEYSGTCGENLTWTFNEATGELVISGFGAMKNYSATAPAPWDTYRSQIKTLTIKSGVTTIGNDTFFGCENLTSVSIPNYLTKIGNTTFRDCINLTEITIPDSVKSIGYYAFYGCKLLSNVDLGKGVTTISNHAFRNCTSLATIALPKTLVSIGNSAFAGCSGLKKAVFQAIEELWNLVTVGTGNEPLLNVLAFEYGIVDSGTYMTDGTWTLYDGGKLVLSGTNNTDSPGLMPWKDYRSSIIAVKVEGGIAGIYGAYPNLRSVELCDGVKIIDDYAFRNCSNLESVSIPDTIISIGENAFEDCDLLKEIILPEGVVEIGAGAFESCQSLMSINIPSTVVDIGDEAFRYCTSLLTITVDKENKIYTSEDNALIDKSVMELICYPAANPATSFSIPEGIVSIGSYAFYKSANLTNVTIPNGIVSIGDYAFYGCSGLTDVTIPDSVTNMEIGAFYECSGLTEVTIGDGISHISDSAFYDCWNIEKVNFPETLMHIDMKAFWGCDKFVDIDIPDSVMCIEDTSFYSYKDKAEREDGTLYIDSYLVDIWTAEGSFTVKEGTVGIARGVFKQEYNLENISLPDSMMFICEDEFSNSAYYKDESNWENGVLYIDNHLIKVKPETTGVVTIKEGTKSIASGAMKDCKNITGVIIPDGVVSIGARAFKCCFNLTDLTIPESVKYIGDSAFSSCKKIKHIELPADITHIGDYAFCGSDMLTGITIPAGVKLIGSSAFSEIDNLDYIEVDPENTRYSSDEIGVLFNKDKTTLIQFPTYNCEITEYTIPDSVTHIYESAFFRSPNLRKIIVGSGVKYIGDHLFENCSGLKSIVIQEGATSIGYRAFVGCEALEEVIMSDSVLKLSEQAFSMCSALSNITFSKNLAVIGDFAFDRCYSVSSLTIPDSVVVIGDEAFYACARLGQLSIGNNVKTIGLGAFGACGSLGRITFPVGVEFINNGAFANGVVYVYFEGTKEQWESIIIDSNNEQLLSAEISFESVDDHKHAYMLYIITTPTCKDEGLYFYRCRCGDNYEKIVPVRNHTWGEWTVTAEPTTENEGSKTRTCSVCSKEETESIPKLEVIVNEETGIEIVFGEEYGDGVEVQASEVYDGKSFQLVEENYGNVKTTIFDISTTVDGVAVQPSGKVKVRIPLPEGFGEGKVVVCYVDSENDEVTSIPAKVVDGYVEFETDHFSHYALLATKGEVHSVKIDDIRINYKDTMIIRPEIYADDGVSYTVTYSSSNPSVAQVNQNGKITATAFGGTTITCTVTDEYGNTVTEKFTVNVRYTFWQWIIMLFLFGELWY